jgi:ribonuclease P protein component
MTGSFGKTWTSLRGKRQFERVFNGGERQAGRYFTLFLLLGTEGRPRLGLVVSRKVARDATRRNMIKRIVRESFRHAEMAGQGGFDLVVLARPGLALVDRREIRASLDRQIARAATRLSFDRSS